MQYGNSSGSGHYTSFSSTSATASLGALRERSLPPLVAAPQFGSPKLPGWLGRFENFFNRYGLVLAMVALLAAIATVALPAWAALRPEGATSRLGHVRSSAGVTGSAATRVVNLNADTFLGGIPFVQQTRVYGDATSASSSPARFVQAVPQASIGDYIGNVGQQIVLPYLHDAAVLKSDVNSWKAAVQAQQAAVSASAPYTAAFETPAIAPGTVIPGARTTFYSCIGNGFCGNMYNGQTVFAGAAACSTNLPLGTRFFLNNDPSRQVYTCLDRGALSATWVDIWFYNAEDGWNWQRTVGGTYGDITIVQ